MAKLTEKKPHQPSYPGHPNLWAMGIDAGLKIAAPLIVLELIGIRLDKMYGTTPFFIIFTLIFAFLTSTVILFRDVKRLNSQANASKKKIL